MTTGGFFELEASRADGSRVAYRVFQPLGRGAGAQVWLAHKGGASGEAGPVVALKVAEPGLWSQRLEREARLLQAIAAAAPRQRRIIRLGEERELLVETQRPEGLLGPQAILELDWLQGETLRQWMERFWFKASPTPQQVLREALSKAIDIAAALEILYALPGGAIVHRDIKPDNLMVTPEGLVLFDFNIARQESAAEMTAGLGTWRYAAPEVLSGEHYDSRADLYSVGIILWEILEQAPFPAVHAEVPWQRSRWCQVDFPRRRELEQVLTRLVCAREARLNGPKRLRIMLEDLQPVVAQMALCQWPQPAREAHPAPALPPAPSAPPRAVSSDAPAASLLPAQGAEPARVAPLEPAPAWQPDLIELLTELRPGGLMSVVVADGHSQGALQERIQRAIDVADPLEDLVFSRVAAALDGTPGAPRLIVLAGNAGDGKSHLIKRLRARWEALPGGADRVAFIADATHADRPDQSQRERLDLFFAPLSGQGEMTKAVYLVAMNTGMVIHYFENAENHAALRDELFFRLGLAPAPTAATSFPVEVVNLDLRDLLHQPTPAVPCFAEKMLLRLDPQATDGLVYEAAQACGACSAASLCPVLFNLQALCRADFDHARRALFAILQRVALDAEVHLSPRLLWAFFYHLITGGQGRYQRQPGMPAGLCAVVRHQVARRDFNWLHQGHFYQILFGGGPESLWTLLTRFDPADVAAPAIDRLQTRLGVNPKVEREAVVQIKRISAEAGVALSIDFERLGDGLDEGQEERDQQERRDAVVRRQVFFEPALLDDYLARGVQAPFVLLLEAYRKWSLGQTHDLRAEEKEAIKDVVDLLRMALLQAYGRTRGERNFFKVSHPNTKCRSELLVAVQHGGLERLLRLEEVLRRDDHILAHQGRAALLAELGYCPRMLTLVVQGFRINLDVALYDFLLQVKAGQQPSSKDLAQFQALHYVGERIGNTLAGRDGENQALYVLDEEKGFFLLTRDVFGTTTMEPVEV